MTKCCSADALDSLRRVVIGNEPLAAGRRSCGAFDTLPTSGWKGTFVTLLALIQICLQEELSRKRIGGEVVGIERFVLPACADLVRLTS